MLSLFSNWINYAERQPDDGQQVIAYIVIPEGKPDVFGVHKQHAGKTLVGPMVVTIEKKYIDKAWHRTPAYWQPIDELPMTM